MTGITSICSQIFIMLALILCGVFLYKINWISNDTNKQLSKIVISFVNPALMFYAYNIPFETRYVRGLILAFAISVLMHLIYILCSKIFILNDDVQIRGLERYCVIYSNCAFIGIPLVQAVYGSEGVFYVTAYITIFNLLMWTHGVVLIGNVKDFNIVDNILKSPTIIATVLGMFVFFLKLEIPELILKPVYYISSLNTPLAMIVSGVTIAQISIINSLRDVRVYLIAFIKLLAVPMVLILSLSFLDISETALMSTILVGACPTATASVLLSIQYGNDEGYASRIFGVTTILSMITLPLLVYVGSIL